MINLINQLILNSEYYEPKKVNELKSDFSDNKYVYLPELFSADVFSLIRKETQALEQHALTKNYRSDGTDTPRYLRTFGGEPLIEMSPLLAILYAHYELRGLLSSIVSGPVYQSTHSHEIIGVHYQEDVGHTHGWHLDDNGFLFIITVDAPDAGNGGSLEAIPEWQSYARKLDYQNNDPLEPYIAQCRDEEAVYEYHHKPADAYLLRADKVLHRVTPMIKKGKRSVVVFGFNYTPETQYSDRATGIYSR